jgi:glycoside/pentoside/hexuronide:cation symporter, GPH family
MSSVHLIGNEEGNLQFGKVRLSEKFAYGLGDFSSNLLWGASGSFLMYFYVNVVRLPVADVAVLFLVTRVLDAFVDPVFGYWIDRTGSQLVVKLIKWLAIPFGLVAFFTFLPLQASDTVKLIWAFVTYTLFGLVYSGINTPYGVLGNLVTADPGSRVSLGVYRMLGMRAGSLLIALATIPAIHVFGGGTDTAAEWKGFPIYMGVIGVIGAIMWFAVAKGCKIRHYQPGQQVNIWPLLKSLASNRPWIVCSTGFGLFFFLVSAVFSLAIYYAKDVLGESTAFGGYILSLYTVGATIGTLVVSPVSRRMGRKKTLVASYAIQFCALGILWTMPASKTAFFPCMFTVAMMQGIAAPLFYAMISDSVDFGLERTGIRTTGTGYSIVSLITKVAFAIGGSLAARFLDIGRYSASLTHQGPDAVRWITFGFVGFPLIVCLASLAVLQFYPSDKRIAEAMNAAS